MFQKLLYNYSGGNFVYLIILGTLCMQISFTRYIYIMPAYYSVFCLVSMVVTVYKNVQSHCELMMC